MAYYVYLKPAYTKIGGGKHCRLNYFHIFKNAFKVKFGTHVGRRMCMSCARHIFFQKTVEESVLPW